MVKKFLCRINILYLKKILKQIRTNKFYFYPYLIFILFLPLNLYIVEMFICVKLNKD